MYLKEEEKVAAEHEMVVIEQDVDMKQEMVAEEQEMMAEEQEMVVIERTEDDVHSSDIGKEWYCNYYHVLNVFIARRGCEG